MGLFGDMMRAEIMRSSHFHFPVQILGEEVNIMCLTVDFLPVMMAVKVVSGMQMAVNT